MSKNNRKSLQKAISASYSILGALAFFGLGGPLISVGAHKLISIWFNERERKLAMGIYSPE